MTKKYLSPKLLYLAPLVLFLVSFIWPIGILEAQNEIKPGDVVINEVYYDAAGQEPQGEWIELYNNTPSPITLDNWSIADNYTARYPKSLDKISSSSILPKNFLIIASNEEVFRNLFPAFNGQIVVISDGKIGNGLSNTGDSLILKDKEGNIIDQISYGNDSSIHNPAIPKVKEGHSIERYPAGKDTDSYSDFIDQEIPTPGQPATQPPSQESEQTHSPSQNSNPEGEDIVALISIKEARKKEKDAEILVQGIVTVLPGTLSANYIYIQDETGGIQVYSSKKNFPNLSLGQKVTVLGTLSEAYNEKRINIQTAQDITILSQEKEPEPLNLKTGQINEDSEGMLVKVTGKVVEPRGNLFYLDDGSGKVKIYIDPDTKIEKPRLKEGQEIEVTGIVSQYKEPYRILPRKSEDLKTKDGKVLAQSSEVGQKSKSKTKKGADEADEEEEIIDDTSSPEPSSQAEKVLGASSRRYNWPWWSVLLGLAFLGSVGYLINDYQNQKRTGNSKIWSKVRPHLERWRNYWFKRRTGRW